MHAICSFACTCMHLTAVQPQLSAVGSAAQAWVPHPEHDWVRAEIITMGDTTGQLKYVQDEDAPVDLDRAMFSLDTAKIIENLVETELPEHGIEDMSNLNELHEVSGLGSEPHTHSLPGAFTSQLCESGRHSGESSPTTQVREQPVRHPPPSRLPRCRQQPVRPPVLPPAR